MTKLQDIIEETVRTRLDSVKIVHVDVEEELDHDGDAILTISIVFDGEVSDLNMDRFVGLRRHLRTELETIQEERFPITRIMTLSDFEGMAA